MSDGNSRAPESQISITERLDRICDPFEMALTIALESDGERPRIENWLDQAPVGYEEALLRELLTVELELRYAHGEPCSVGEYLPRFAEQQERVAEIFAEAAAKRRLGDYLLLEELGHGGMGVVHRAMHVMLDSVFAVKVLHERSVSDSNIRSRFLREMRSIGSLRHANVVQAHNAGEVDGRRFLVMEYVDGPTLHKLVTFTGRMPVGAACEVIRQAALGLQHAHEHGLVHRDIKPGNLILTPDGTVKVLDLGLARFTEDHRILGEASEPLSASMAMGTADYMPPEQWENPSRVDIRADIYALGCTWFYLLTGRAPYEAPSFQTMRKKLMAHSVAPIPKLTDHVVDCPEDLNKILAHMLGKEPEHRFDTPSEVTEVVELFADPEALQEQLRVYATLRKATADVPTLTIPTAQNSTDRESSRKLLKELKKNTARSAAQSMLSRTTWAVALAVAVLGLVAYGAWWLGKKGHRPEPPPPVVNQSGPNNQESGPVTAPVEVTLAQHEQIAFQILLMPGLNGEWWFDEMPWLTPFARQAICQNLDGDPDLRDWAALHSGNPNIALQPDTKAAQQWLRNQVLSARDQYPEYQQTLLDTLLDISQKPLMAEELQNVLVAARDQFAEEATTPVDLHTLAVLQHKLANTVNSTAAVEEARVAYEIARNTYAESGTSLDPLQRLCLLDLGQLYAEHMDATQHDNYRTMLGFFQDAQEGVEDPFVRAHILTLTGVGACRKEKYSDGDHFLQSALEILRPTALYELDHPFVAHVNERLAWSTIYQWKVNSAREYFNAAWSIRDGAHRKYPNPLQAAYALHNQHGQAMAERFLADVESAEQHYQEVLTNVRTLLHDVHSSTDQTNAYHVERKFVERESNTAERRADCVLYQGAASGGKQSELAAACTGYETAREKTPNGVIRITMGLKLAIALALHDRLPDAQAAFEQATRELENADNVETDRFRIQLLLPIADAVLTIKAKDVAATNDTGNSENGLLAGQEKLRAILRRMRRDPDVTADKMRAEVLELYLFCAEMLVASEMGRPVAETPSAAPPVAETGVETGVAEMDVETSAESNVETGVTAEDAVPGQADAESIDHLWFLLSLLPGSEELHPYMRRYCEVGVEATVSRDPEMAAAFVRKMRGLSPSDDAAYVVFFLPHYFVQRSQNRAFLLVPDRSCEIVRLDFDRPTVLEPETTRSSFQLPETLLQQISRLREDGCDVRIVWADDEQCWPNGSLQALTEANQPRTVWKLIAATR